MASLLFVTVIRTLLPIINRVHATVLGVKPLGKNGIMCVEVRRHKGRPIKLEDGCEVRPGDPVIKLHFNDAWINEKRRSSSESGSRVFPRGFVSYSKEALQVLAAEVTDDKYGSIVAVYGWTAFYAHARRLGFQVIDLPNTLRIRLARLHVTALLRSQSIPWLKRCSASRKSVEVKAVWFSRAELLRIHGSAS
jgi:hypothetical protein